jgi:hypothetical protein
MFKILSAYICWKQKKYMKCNIWRVAVRPSYVKDTGFLEVKQSRSNLAYVEPPSVHNKCHLLSATKRRFWLSKEFKTDCPF